ncbi:MAG: GMP/IMP nucleotidase [Gammaproteobacteria bacterium]|nr:GMP/IMP nucleotidase [Gammaproteobacteria bacterium]
MLPWSTIDTVMFDMDGTLLDLHFDNYFWLKLVPYHYSKKYDVSEAEAEQFVRQKYSDVHGTLKWYCIDYWQAEFGLNIPQLKLGITHKITVRPNVEHLLQALQQLDKRLVLVTNAHPISLDLKMKHAGIRDYFHQCISSHSLKLAKENRGFWENLKAVEPYDPARTALFDDNLSVLREAKRQGIAHLWAISQPDSQLPAVAAGEFPQVQDFEQLLPARG